MRNHRHGIWAVRIAAVLLSLLLCLAAFADNQPAAAKQYRGILTREAHLVNGLSAPIPMYAAQIEQESGWRPGITAFDGGKGLAQFMDSTASDIVRIYPQQLERPQPMNPTWAIRALVLYDTRLQGMVRGIDACNVRGAALKAYNAGIGYVIQAQKISAQPEQWFGVTEYVKTRQTAANFEESRMYPRRIIFQRQPKYKGWGSYTCGGLRP
jgi:soluble lytic murein transglycosylase-like protein